MKSVPSSPAPEIKRGDTTRAINEGLAFIDWPARAGIAEAHQEALALLTGSTDHSRKPLKIGIIGEIYVVLEPAANHYIQRC